MRFFSRVGRKPGIQQGEEKIFHQRGMAQATNTKTNQPVKPTGLMHNLLNLAPRWTHAMHWLIGCRTQRTSSLHLRS